MVNFCSKNMRGNKYANAIMLNCILILWGMAIGVAVVSDLSGRMLQACAGCP